MALEDTITVKCFKHKPLFNSSVCETYQFRIFECDRILRPIVCLNGWVTLTWTKYIVYKQYENNSKV